MSTRKRQRQENGDASQPKKRIAIESSSDQSIKVSHIEHEEWDPILASAPGLSLPNDVSFKVYKNSNKVLLHSSRHPRLDYTAREEPTNGTDSLLKHYIGIYDSEHRVMQLIPAKKLVTRSMLRDHDSSERFSDEDAAPVTGYAARNKLGLAFGTKKSQKAIRNLTVNAINASPSKALVNTDGLWKTKQLDALSEAVISSMAAPTSSMPTREELQVQIDKGKPIPTPHLDASNPFEVYPVAELVGGEDFLRKIQVKEWIDILKAGGDVPTKVFFVARRLLKVAESGDVLKMRILRYLCLLVGWWRCLKPGRSYKVPKLEEMSSLNDFGTELVESLRKRFSKDSTLTKWHQHKVLTHILALALTVDDFNSDVNHIRSDLKLELKELKSLYRELGCPLRPPTETELKQLKITKAEGAMHQHAQLKLPLALPKSRVPVKRRR